MKFEIFPQGNVAILRPPQWYWRLRARNGKIMAIGGEGYAKKGNARRAARRFEAAFRAAAGGQAPTLVPIVEVER